MTQMECETVESLARSLNIACARKPDASTSSERILLFPSGAPEAGKIFDRFWDAMHCLVLMPGRQSLRFIQRASRRARADEAARSH